MTRISIADIQAAHLRIQNTVKRTPLLESSLLNKWLGQRILFKAECLQTVGAFKIRGATNFVARLQGQGEMPKHIVANSSGNHAQAVACTAREYGIPATIFASKNISEVKAAATQSYGAELKLFDSRSDADKAVALAADNNGTVWIPPYNHEDIIAGQGTCALEAIEDAGHADAIFAPCGGGGLLTGTLITARAMLPEAKVIGSEPLLANDAAQSLQSGKIEMLSTAPDTLADGAATPCLGALTFPFIQQLDEFYEVNEQQIAYWTQWLQHLLKMHVEPTSAMSMAAVVAWAISAPPGQTAIVLLTGGNVSQQSMRKIWQNDYLLQPPNITEQE
ncbi:serine/threonine dehydratase [Alteromonas sp. ASW11-130]|uniref:serine/threonine dehydratase n=1 Tax=Alteromonas sp. ASW11-130 TaxID=3015775 RepID=UPI00224217EA|nr:serine/threonine dehydratase [Alteromonas sp. ASW11-130]MCW8092654.1 serine/threonine dehydratase [Alteromonas sp. ASW11-130]